MPVCSYIVHPAEGKAEALHRTLNAQPGCEATLADDHDLIILVTDTGSAEDEEALTDALKQLDDIQCLTLTFGQIQPDGGKEQER